MPPHASPAPSRRHVLTALAGGVTAAAMRPSFGLAAEDAPPKDEGPVQMIRRSAGTAPITVQPLRGGISVLLGSGGNIALFSGPEGKLMVDAGIPASRAKIAAALDDAGPAPLRYLVNTHWHFDHTDGNDWLHDAGATLVAHTNTRKRLSKPTRVAGWRFTFPARAPGALPSITSSAPLTLFFNGAPVHLTPYPAAHTDSDLSVYFPAADVLHTGDTLWNGYYPFIDYSTGGSLDGTIEAAELNLAKAGPDTLVIPGHGPVATRADLVRFRDMLVTVRDRVAALKTQGRSLEQTIAARPTAEYDATWGAFAVDGKTFTELAYNGV